MYKHPSIFQYKKIDSCLALCFSSCHWLDFFSNQATGVFLPSALQSRSSLKTNLLSSFKTLFKALVCCHICHRQTKTWQQEVSPVPRSQPVMLIIGVWLFILYVVGLQSRIILLCLYSTQHGLTPSMESWICLGWKRTLKSSSPTTKT